MHLCSICGKSFNKKHNLTRHMDIHSQKSFQCSHCTKRYSRQAKLKVHLVRHHSKEQHISQKGSLKCMHCSKMFIRSYNLRRHSKKCQSKSCKQLTHDRDTVLFQMRFNQHQFLSQLELGGLVSNLLVEHDDLSEHSLTEENRTALRLHRQYRIPHMSEFENAILNLDKKK